MRNHDEDIWGGAYKIPWDDPDFSRRMLSEHLSQDHDLASRRTEWIDRQVAWIHTELLGSTPSRILDLACGPGLYSHRLTRLGHRGRGIDFGPASVEYARQHNPDASRCEFVLGDLRHVDFGRPYDLAMFLYGEPNTFPPADALAILRKASDSLVSGGVLIAEVETGVSVEQTGRGDPWEQQRETGLFSDLPHRCRTECRWLPDLRVAVRTFTVEELGSGTKSIYRNTTQAWSDGELAALLTDAGFRDPRICSTWPVNNDTLVLWTATAA